MPLSPVLRRGVHVAAYVFHSSACRPTPPKRWFTRALLALSLCCFPGLLAIPAAAATRATQTALKAASPLGDGAKVTDVQSFITLTAEVRAEGKPVSPGLVLFCDADAPFCDNGALVGRAQLGSNGLAVLRISPKVIARHHHLKAVFVGTNAFAASASAATPFTIPDPPYDSTTQLKRSGTPANYTLAATVIGGMWFDDSIPPGQVTFVDTITNNILGTRTLGNGVMFDQFGAQPSSGSTHANPVAMVSADFNSDGIPDLATANAGAFDVTVLLNDRGGNFGTVSAVLSPGSRPTSIATADFNGDGFADLVVNHNTGAGVSIYLGHGDGTFSAAGAPPATVAAPTAVAVGDFNHDGNMDIAVAGSNRIAILLGQGNGTFIAAASMAVVSGPQSLAVADFNGDHVDDLAVGAAGAHSVAILLSNGDGTFHAAPSVGSFASPTAIATGDFNNDGKADLSAIDTSHNSVTTLLGNGSGGFHAASVWLTGTSPSALVATDINADGKLDLAVTNSGSNNIIVLIGKGNGTFYLGSHLATGSQPSAIVADNFLGPEYYEAFTDLIVADKGSSTTDTWINTVIGESFATLTHVSIPGVGTHSVVAKYSGGGDWNPSTSSAVSLSAYLATSTSLSLSASTIKAGTNVSLTARVVANGNAVTSGSVLFCNANVASCTGAALFGKATLNAAGTAVLTRTFSAGTYSLKAVFPATSTDAGSTSAAKVLTVKP